MEHNVNIINRGVDTLLLNIHLVDSTGNPRKGELVDSLVEQLEGWKKEAQYLGDPLPTEWVFQGVHLLMRPNGAGRGHWQWLLTSRLLNISLSRGKWNGGIAQVRLSSEYLWSLSSLDVAIAQVHDFFRTVLHAEVFLQVSEVHVCVDLTGWEEITTLDHRREFVSRSRQRRAHEQADWNYQPGDEMDIGDFSFGLTRTGFSFSPKGTVSCGIYDKSREIKRSGKGWFEDKWLANGWEEEQTVWRIEFRFEREALHELHQVGDFHGLENAYELAAKVPVLWAYAAGQVDGGLDGKPDGWLRYVVPQEETSRSRWPTHPVWRVVQGAFQGVCETPQHFGEIVRKRHYDHNIQKGLEAIVGYASSLASWVGDEFTDPNVDLTVFLHWLAIHGQKYLTEREMSFGAEIQRKRIIQGVLDIPCEGEVEAL